MSLRRYMCLGIAAFASTGAEAGQLPTWIPMDGILFDAAGAPVTETGVEFQFSVRVIGTGDEVTAETQYLDIDAGYYTTFLELNASMVQAPLEIVVTVAGETMTPSIPIGSVAYSLRAATADDAERLGGLSLSEVLDSARLEADATTFEGMTLDELLEAAQTGVDAETLGGLTLEELVVSARTGVDAETLDGATLADLLASARTDVDAVTLEGQNVADIVAAAQGETAHNHAPLLAGSGLLGSSYDGEANATFSVAYGADLNTAVEGSQTFTLAAGNGLVGGAADDELGDGVNLSLSVGAGSGIAVAGAAVGLGVLTSDWNQTGAFDVVLQNASSELKILESAGGVFYGTLDVGDLTSDATYTFGGASGTVWTSGNDGSTSTLDAHFLDGQSAAAFAAAAHAHQTLTAGTGLAGGSYDANASKTFSVAYGTTGGTAVEGNQTLTITAGAGLTGGVAADALGNGVTAPLDIGAGSGISVGVDAVSLGALSSDWNQTGAFDVVLQNASSELKILESAGGAFYGSLDVGDLTSDATYTFSGASGTVWTSGNDGSTSTLDAHFLDGQSAAAFAAAAHAHQTLTAGTGLAGGSYDANASKTFSVAYGTTSGTAVEGNQTLTITAGAGLTGGVSADTLGNGVTAPLDIGAGSGISVGVDAVSLGALSSDWNQTGAFDVVLQNASSELKILESGGGVFYGTLDVGDLTSDATYAFGGASGTVWTSGNDGSTSTLDADLLDGQTSASFATAGHTHPALSAGTGLAGGPYDGGGLASFSVLYGLAGGTAVEGNQTLTITAGAGLTGGVSADALGNGVTAALTIGAGNGISVDADSVAIGALTSNWTQSGAYDIVLDNASSEITIRAPAGAIYGTLEIGDLSADAIYTFSGLSGTVWTGSNDGTGSGLDADTIDGFDINMSGAWSTLGNNATTPGTNYLGTGDNQALELKVNAVRALRVEPTTQSGANYGGANMIGGYSRNGVTSGVYGAVISGGGGVSGSAESNNTVSDSWGTIGGGRGNRAGDGDAVTTDKLGTFVGGGITNRAEGNVSAVVGGLNNQATGDFTSIGGGRDNTASQAYAVVTGGYLNNAQDVYSAICGGFSNDVLAGATSAFIGGGQANTVTASGSYGTVGGGNSNTVSAAAGTVAGGQSNTASGPDSMVPGGSSNTASANYAFAAGRRAKALNAGCFVWGDSTDADVNCSAANQFVARASGGVTFYTNSLGTTGVRVPAGGGAWESVSDRDAKRDIEAIDPLAVLDRVVAMPIARWRYRTETSGALHMGPMAQDFHAAFGLGDSDRSISVVDADGVALAAIQGLYLRVREVEQGNAALQRERDELLERDAARMAEVAELRAAVAQQAAQFVAYQREVEALLQALRMPVNVTNAASICGDGFPAFR